MTYLTGFPFLLGNTAPSHQKHQMLSMNHKTHVVQHSNKLYASSVPSAKYIKYPWPYSVLYNFSIPIGFCFIRMDVNPHLYLGCPLPSCSPPAYESNPPQRHLSWWSSSCPWGWFFGSSGSFGSFELWFDNCWQIWQLLTILTNFDNLAEQDTAFVQPDPPISLWSWGPRWCH